MQVALARVLHAVGSFTPGGQDLMNMVSLRDFLKLLELCLFLLKVLPCRIDCFSLRGNSYTKGNISFKFSNFYEIYLFYFYVFVCVFAIVIFHVVVGN